MTGLRRFHPAYSVQLMRRWLAVCLLPLLNALRAFDLAAFRAALWQEGALLLALAAAAVLLWLPAGWKLEQGSLVICRGLAARRTLRLRPEEIASLEIRENPVSRLFGAAQMTLYPRRSGPKPRRLSLWLPRRAAHELAETLIPLREERPLYVPTRAGRLYLVLLTANGLVTGLLAFVSVQRSDQLAAAELKRMWAAAMQGLIGVERLAQRVLPVSLSWLLTLMGAVWFVGIAGGFLRSAGYRVYRGRAVILARGGLLTLRERRVRPGCVTSAEVRITPLARLLGRCLVYLRAGADSGDDTPVMVWRMKDGVEPLRRLMPSFRLPPPRPEPLTGRSLPAFLALPGILTAVVAVGWLSSLWRLPTASLPLGVGLLLCLGLVAVALEGFFCEGLRHEPGGPPTLCFTKRYTRYLVCIFSPQRSARMYQTPFSMQQGRCHFKLFVSGCRYRLRSLRLWPARHVPL